MALTRKFLAALDIPAEKVEEIISAHTETVSAIKEERDAAKADADRLAGVEKKLENVTKELEELKSGEWEKKSGEWEKKYNEIKSEYDSFKTDTETKATKAAVKTAYKQLLLDNGINPKRVDSVLKVSDLDSIKLDSEGKIEDAEKLTETIKAEWADFITSVEERGADIPNPPANTGGETKPKSRAAELVAQYRAEHYGEKEG